MARINDALYRILEMLLVGLLAGMVALVFANAVARYAFDYSIHIADELPRFLFVWLTFIGAAIAHRHSLHLGMKFVITSMPRSSWRYLMAASEALVLACALLLMWGSLGTWRINATVVSPILGVPLIYVQGVALLSAVLMATTSLDRLARALTGRVSADELAAFSETEDDKVIAETRGRLD
ncbi:TRAP transporter small permease [Arvimicrobium flavum]|uniref:TRAP transporter small permease n=1 Tax=Arvimicrobium flavum TaxID=3393320 RepID=UPI00237AD6E0|nr:TRAP transporter small permease [Mesorhizobium shangrilense]